MFRKIALLLSCSLILVTFSVIFIAGPSVLGETVDGVSVFRPTDDIVNEWGPGTGTGYTEVDEEVADGTQTYIGTSIDGRKDIYSFNVETISGVKSVTVFARFITDFKGSMFSLILYDSSAGSIFYSTPVKLPGSGKWYTISYNWELNPFTGQDWKDEDVQFLGFGICADYCDRGSAVFCTQVCLEISYETSEPQPPDDGDDQDPPPVNDTNSSDDEELTIEQLIEEVMLLNIPKRLKRRLVRILNRAIKFFNRDRIKRVIQILNSFIRNVKRFDRRNKLTDEDANRLIDMTQKIIYNLKNQL
jgi:hypothetical protein